MNTLKSYNILLLEDDIEFAFSLSETLKFYFASVYFASTIDEASKLLNSEKVDVIMSDIHLKKENGLDFISQLQKEDASIPIIIISGFDDKEFLMRSIKLGVVDYMLKPFDLEDLEKALNRASKHLQPQQRTLYKIRDEVYFDKAKKTIQDHDKEVTLTAKEYLFLELLFSQKELLFTRDMIEEAVYKEESMSSAALKNLLFRIRKKLGKDLIITLPELGYKVNIGLKGTSKVKKEYN